MIKNFFREKSQIEDVADNTKQNNIDSIEKRLENKWWHRMIKVFIWFISYGVLSYCCWFMIEEMFFLSPFSTLYEMVVSIILFLSFSFLCFFTVFFLLKLFYCKIVMYIIYGQRIELAKKNFTKIMLFIMGGLILLFIISVVLINTYSPEMGQNQDQTTTNETEETLKEEYYKRYDVKIIDSVNLGSSIKCTKNKLFCNDLYTNGKFIKVVFQINNITTETITGGRIWSSKLPWNSGKIIDNQNREYEKNDNTMFIPNLGESECNLSELKPNLPKQCIKIYEVSADSEGFRIKIDKIPDIELGI